MIDAGQTVMPDQDARAPKPAAPLLLRTPNPTVGFIAGIGVALHNVWSQRQLIREFVVRDVRLKYRGSAFGYIWTVLEPLLMALVFVVLFSIVARQPERTYALRVLLGVILWTHFASSLTKAQSSLTHNAGLIEQIYVPREVFAFASVAAQLIMTTLSLAVAIPFLIYFQIMPTWTLLYVPVGLTLLTAFALGFGLLTAPLNVLNRDVEYFTAFAMKAGMYLSPVMWGFEMIPGGWMRTVVLANPVTVPMELIKHGVEGRALPMTLPMVAYAVAASFGMLFLGLAVFRRLEGVVVKKL